MNSQSPLRVLIVDDEAPARRKILRLLRQESTVEIAGEADGGEAAVTAIKKLRPDLLFLDVQMPGLDGFGVIRSLNAAKIPLPQVIFVTAHDRFALRAFEDRKSTRLNSSHSQISYAVFCLKKKTYIPNHVHEDIPAHAHL